MPQLLGASEINETTNELLNDYLEHPFEQEAYVKLFMEFFKDHNMNNTIFGSYRDIPEYNKIINSILLDVVGDLDNNASKQEVFTKYLKLINVIHVTDEQILLAPSVNQLIDLLADNKYPEYSGDICEIISKGKYKLTNEQSIKLNKAVSNTNNNRILELLIDTDNTSGTLVSEIIHKVRDNKGTPSEAGLHKEQLLIIAGAFKENKLSKYNILPSLLDIFKSHPDSNFTISLAKTIGNKESFTPVLQESAKKLESLSHLFKIDQKVSEIKKNNDNSRETKDSLLSLFNSPNIITTDELQKFVITYLYGNEYCIPEFSANLLSNYKKLEIIKIIGAEIEIINRAFHSKIPITEELFKAYEKYFHGILKIGVLNLPQEHYNVLLKTSIHKCSLLLQCKFVLSDEVVKDLIDNLDKNLINNIVINNILTIFSVLSSQNKISSIYSEKIFSIFKKYIMLQQPADILNMIEIFERTLKSNSTDQKLSEEYVNKLIEVGSGKLIELLLDPDYEIVVKTQIVKLLQKIPGSIDQANIIKITRLLTQEEKVLNLTCIGSQINFENLLETKYEVINNKLTHKLLRLIKDYALQHKSLPALVILTLEQAAKCEELKADITNILNIAKGVINQSSNIQGLQQEEVIITAIEEAKLKKLADKIPENKGEILFTKLVELNPELNSKILEYKTILEKIHNLYSSGANAISKWNAAQIKEWAVNYKTNNNTNVNSKEEIAKIIAILEQANNLYTAKDGKQGHLLRDTQIISLLLLLDVELSNKGKLLQVATGEGKSTISAMLAAILALYGTKVDLVTSSKVLANTGYTQAKGFFEMLGLTVGINTEKSPLKGQKACYSCDIVYGDALSFQADYLSNTSHQSAKRGDRDCNVVIVDEVDSMLLDSSNNMAKQSSPTPLMEYLIPLLVMAWNNFHRIIKPLDLDQEIATDKAKELIEALIDQLPIPQHLQNYAKFQAKNWASSLVGAVYAWEIDKHYVININNDGKKIINPVDNSTGVTLENTVWQNGLHQFLQIKHRCYVTAEGLTTFFITNISYFQKYNRILGMTGTLGSTASQEFLKEIYGVELSYVPPYKDKQLTEMPGRLEFSYEDYEEAIINSSYTEAVTNKRAVLIVCQTIKEAENFCKLLKNRYGDEIKLINYSRSEEKLYNLDIEKVIASNTIIVATNLAGRGTDIRTNLELEENGGLHVISTFIAKNARDEAQIKGRTARQGNKGSYQLIAFEENYEEYEAAGYTDLNSILAAKLQLRSQEEQENITQAINEKIPALKAQDELYNKFSTLYLKLIGDNEEIFGSKDAKIRQLIEDFGIWFQTSRETGSIEEFLAQAESKYHREEFSNPSYQITQHYGINDGRAVVKLLAKALESGDIYNFAAHYYTAKGWINIGKTDKNYCSYAVNDLMIAANKISELVAYLTAMNIELAYDTSESNELLEQTTGKIEFFQNLLTSIDSAVKEIEESQKPNKEVKVKTVKTKKEFSPNLSKLDLLELENLGVETIFELEQYKIKQKWQGTIFVGCCSIVQMAVGACIAIGTLGGGITIASSIFVEGLMDAYKVAMSLKQHQAINLNDYLTSKAINYAIIGAQVGFDKLANAGKTGVAAKEAGKTAAELKVAEAIGVEGAKHSSKELIVKTVIELAKTSGVQLAKMIAIEKVTELAVKAVNDNALSGLEKKIENQVASNVTAALNSHNGILLSGYSRLEQELIIRAVQQACFNVTKTSKHTRVLNELTSGVFCAAGSHYPVGALLHGVQRTAVTVDAISKIEPILDDIKEQAIKIITKLAEQANVRLNGKTLTSEHAAIRESLSHNIGKIAANAMMNFINRKVTAPIIGQLTSSVVNDLLKDFQAKQHETLAAYSEATIVKREQDAIIKKYSTTQEKLNGNLEQVEAYYKNKGETVPVEVILEIIKGGSTPLIKDGKLLLQRKNVGRAVAAGDEDSYSFSLFSSFSSRDEYIEATRVKEDDQTNLKRLAQVILKLSKEYANYEREYPTLTKMLLSTITIVSNAAGGAIAGLTTGFGGAVLGGVVGTINGVKSEIIGTIQGQIVGGAVEVVIKEGIKLGAEKLQKLDPQLTNEEAAALAGGALLAGLAVQYGSSVVKPLTTGIQQFRVQKTAFAGVSDHVSFFEMDNGISNKNPLAKKDIFDGNKQPGKVALNEIETKVKPGRFDYEEYWKKVKLKEKIDYTKVEYEPSPKHHPNAPKGVSKAPTEPNEALKNAYKYNEKSKALIAVDVKNNEIVMFKLTHDNKYHGYVIDINSSLKETNKISKFLEGLELIKSNGKIIK